MSNSEDAQKRIMKNTIMLYIRMIVLMAVSLFTSRVILQTLGVDDFGVRAEVKSFIMNTSVVDPVRLKTRHIRKQTEGEEIIGVGIEIVERHPYAVVCKCSLNTSSKSCCRFPLQLGVTDIAHGNTSEGVEHLTSLEVSS